MFSPHPLRRVGPRLRSARSLRVFAVVLLAAALTGITAVTAQAGPPSPQVVTPPHTLGALGGTGWQVLSSATATQSGTDISTPGFDTSGWLTVHNDDGDAPGTEIEALLQNGACPNVYYSDNMRTCFGYTTSSGVTSVPEFAVPWWYRTDFTAHVNTGQVASLTINGVVGAADVWVDGQEVATQTTVTGAYTKFTFDVTGILKSGTNTLALEVYPNNPKTMFTLDDVDWNQVPPDNNTGIQFPIVLKVADALSESNAHVVENNAADLSSSSLTVKVDVTNNTGSDQTGVVAAVVRPPAGSFALPVAVDQTVTVAADTTQTVTFDPATYGRLTIAHPQIWWPYQIGPSPLYTLSTSVKQSGRVLDSARETFGIQTVTSELVGPSTLLPAGARSYSINGQPFVVRGGGFSPNIFLNYSSADIARQISILKNMGMNVLRLEGHFMPEDFYEQMDRAGIMIDSGFQCCDAWQAGKTISDANLAIMANSAAALGANERNHPSVITFSWSDNQPRATQEQVTEAAFAADDFDVPLVASAEYKQTATLGYSGEKEGPYDWVPPDYWYDNTNVDTSDGSRTNQGGAWGLDSEQSAGDTVPTLDSIQRFMSPAEQDALWQDPSYNQYHANYEPDHGGYAFGTLYTFDQALTSRYGAWDSLDSYVEEAQLQNYENTRSQFEAALAHSTVTDTTPSTGTIYWQANKGWPSLLWNLYNSDGDQAGSFFGAKKANETVHALYTYDTGTVSLDNLGTDPQHGLSVESKVYDLAGNVLDDQKANGIQLTSQQVATGVLTPHVPAATTAPDPAQTYFVELLVKKGGSVVDRNVYWLSTQQDEVDWSSTLGEPQATMTQYADLQGLASLSTGSVQATAFSYPAFGPNGADRAATITVTNTSKTKAVDFFLRADLRRGNPNGTEKPGDNQVTSALWSDDDITLWPGESQTLTVTYRSSDLGGATPVVSLYGDNTPKIDVRVF